jgi:hypothetical protein
MNIPRRHRGGFSIVEVTVSGFLLVLLSVLISNAWIGIGRPLIETTYRCRVAQESVLALTSLARDFGGGLADGSGALGNKLSYRLVGRTQPGGNELWLCYDGGASPNGLADWLSPDVVVTYRVVDNALIRSNVQSGDEFVVAKNVESLSLSDLGGEVEINLSFAYHGIHQSYTLVAKDP